jgi:thiamine-monophosphate kinase
VVSLGVPLSTPVRWTDALGRGLRRCARRFGVALVGGDTVRAPQVVIDVAILGTVARKALTLRSGAKRGDRLFVTGRLGGSYVSGRHARFTPRVGEAQALLRRVPIQAMIDLSDGLAPDLWQMARASRVTLQVEADRIPVSGPGRTVGHALMDGEDFELLFAVPARLAHRVPRRVGRCPVTEIGFVRRSSVVGVELVQSDGRTQRVVPRGFAHFSEQRTT